MTPDELSAISHELKTQDNRITEEPLFCVYQKARVYGVDPDFHDHVLYYRTDDGDRVPYIEVDEFVNAHFTEKAAKEHIRINGHNLIKPFVYTTSLWRCQEMIKIRHHLMNYAQPANLGANTKQATK